MNASFLRGPFLVVFAAIMMTSASWAGPLHDAIEAGDVAALRKAIDAGSPIDEVDDQGLTALMLAADKGATDAAVALLDAGAKLDATDTLGRTPLHHTVCWAQRMPRNELVTLFASRGASVEAKNAMGWTPLHEAARAGDATSITLLVALRADASARTPDGWTPLMIAAASNDPWRWSEWLSQEDANREKDKGGDAPAERPMIYGLMIASFCDILSPSSKVFALLRQGKADPNAKAPAGLGVEEVLGKRTDPEAEVIRSMLRLARAGDGVAQPFDDDFIAKHFPQAGNAMHDTKTEEPAAATPP